MGIPSYKPTLNIGCYTDGVVVWWTAVPSAKSYEVYRCDPDGSNMVLLADDYTETWYFDEDVEAEVPYAYYVVPVNRMGRGPASDLVEGMRVLPIEIIDDELPAGLAGDLYSHALSAQHGLAPYRWELPSYMAMPCTEGIEYAPQDLVCTWSWSSESADDEMEYPLPFSFHFFGRDYDSVRVDKWGTVEQCHSFTASSL